MLPDNSEQALKGVLFLFNQLCPEAVLHSVFLGCFHKVQFKKVVTHQEAMSHTFSLWNFKLISVLSSFPLINGFKSFNCVLIHLGKTRMLGNAGYQTPEIDNSMLVPGLRREQKQPPEAWKHLTSSTIFPCALPCIVLTGVQFGAFPLK